MMCGSSRAFFFGCLRRTAHNNLNSDIDSILISFRLDESNVLEDAVEPHSFNRSRRRMSDCDGPVALGLQYCLFFRFSFFSETPRLRFKLNLI
jgi:hypothetical protein